MVSIFLSLLLGQQLVPSYGEARDLALKEGKPLAVSVGCPLQQVDGHILCQVDSLEGYPTNCLVLSHPPSEGRLLYKTTVLFNALEAVNDLRSRRGLRPFILDRGLTTAAQGAATFRAARRIAGHTSNDFSFLPSGSNASAAGCAAWEMSWGWGSCCTYENHTYAGAAWAIGGDGKRYMHLFVR